MSVCLAPNGVRCTARCVLVLREAGPVPCPRCGQPVPADSQPWQLCLVCQNPIQFNRKAVARAPVR